ncbi:MAG: hypothetical protein ABR548_07980 [Actinomycetota bacterium]|nr:hypothetical protein [Actinomycetota bacterium]
MDVYLERGSKRVFAGVLEWPGWCRSGRDDEAALQALVDYAPRYRAALKTAARDFPKTVPDLVVRERLRGDATTDFGAPGIPPKFDSAPLDDSELRRLVKILRASWSAFDRTAAENARRSLRKGPRGGGRDVDGIVAHVYGADKAYLARLGGSYRGDGMKEMRAALVSAITARAHNEPVPENPRRKAMIWPPRYGVRRSAWHALDHAWEIEDRAQPAR